MVHQIRKNALHGFTTKQVSVKRERAIERI